MRQAWWYESRETSWRARAAIVLMVSLAHLAVFFLMARWVPSPGGPGGGPAESVRVRVTERHAPPVARPGKKPPRREAVSPPGPKSATAPRLPKARATPGAPAPTSVPDVVENESLAQNPLKEGESSAPRLSRLLPQGSPRYMEEQRALGADDAGQREAREEFVPRPEVPGKVERPRVVTTEFSTLAFRIELERRFSEAWGGVRTLPPGSLFHGIPGELIAYNVIINRDGTLRRIVNVSALEQAGRDFSDVDALVRSFADSVFPMNPIPERIRDNPFIVRWTLRFVGNRWGLF